MAESFDIEYANKCIDSVEEMLDGIMVGSNTIEQQGMFTYEEYVELLTLVDRTKAAIAAYYQYLERTGQNAGSSYLTEMLYGGGSRIDTIEHAENMIAHMEEAFGLSTEGAQEKHE